MKNPESEAARWLKESETDLLTAKAAYKENIYSRCCFHCEQTIQMALKSFLYFKGERFIQVHAVKKLIEKCIRYDDEFRKFEDIIKVFDRYYLSSRYPDAIAPPAVPSEVYTEKEAKESLNIAGEIYQFVKTKVSR